MRKLLITATLLGGFVAGRLLCADLLVVARRPREGTDLRFGRPPAHPGKLGAHLGTRYAGPRNAVPHAWRCHLTREHSRSCFDRRCTARGAPFVRLASSSPESGHLSPFRRYCLLDMLAAEVKRLR